MFLSFFNGNRITSFGSEKKPPKVLVSKYLPENRSFSTLYQYPVTNIKSVWCASNSPCKIDSETNFDSFNLFLGGQESYSITKIASDNPDPVPNHSRYQKTNSTVLSADFIDTSTGIFGLRNGKICLFDVRSKSYISDFINLETPVTNLEVIDNPYVVVSGLGETLGMFDVRYTQSRHSNKKLMRTHNNHNTAGSESNKSSLGLFWCYEGYENKYHIKHGFKIFNKNQNSRNSKMLAVSQDDDLINVYNVWNGNLVRQISLKHEQTKQVLSSALYPTVIEANEEYIIASDGNRIHIWELDIL